MNLLRGEPQVPEEYVLCQEAQQEGPEEDAGQHHQGREHTCRGHQGSRKAQGGQAEDLMGSNRRLSRLASIAHPKLRKRACAHITEDLRLCQPEAKDKAQTKAAALAAALALALAQAPKGTQLPAKGSRVEAFIC
ncbi:hypothetical protein CB1_000999010 [Camelus ferus]|nr:hypothetical protein CB1_000999010 [Camelus ferus]